MHEFVVYSRRGCHLCEELLEILEPLCRGKAKISVRDIDTNPEWQEAFGLLVPVVYLGEKEVCRYQLDRQQVIDLLVTVDD
ncbi:MAG: glutaredoxin family protein [Gammaproteobacteria bacterium]|nr:glutaredoxin family protein [Gammaproteobacteria bacterium]MCP4088795.1 glutaredoxin family protein [Gammaproteobacteria bacterium]MCP4275906.1 glutaredoxin family protein [Gammaproteobacteria bacterium]MCP4832122.1 glutaredoxin family protein [Gammaproteobacteria bacterium]MCP4928277.1 glutaredoxin family protein [Gammaproteobacteria bacterium]